MYLGGWLASAVSGMAVLRLCSWMFGARAMSFQVGDQRGMCLGVGVGLGVGSTLFFHQTQIRRLATSYLAMAIDHVPSYWYMPMQSSTCVVRMPSLCNGHALAGPRPDQCDGAMCVSGQRALASWSVRLNCADLQFALLRCHILWGWKQASSISYSTTICTCLQHSLMLAVGIGTHVAVDAVQLGA